MSALKAVRFDRRIIGETLGISTVTVEGQATFAYALATNDSNPVYVPGASDAIAPPLYQTRLAALAMPRETMVALGIDVVGPRLGMHAEHDFSFFAPIRPGESIVTEAKVASLEDHRRGEMAEIQITSRTAQGESRCSAKMRILFLDPSPTARGLGATSRASAGATAVTGRVQPVAKARVVVTPDQSLRYAEASGDHTPTHVDERVAKKFGFPTLLLQGLCTMAFAGTAVVDELADGDPTRLHRLRVRFTSPVFPGDVLTTAIWHGQTEAEYCFEMTNQRGATVIRDGIAEVATTTQLHPR